MSRLLAPAVGARAVDAQALRTSGRWVTQALRRPIGSRRAAACLDRAVSDALDAFEEGQAAGWAVQGRLPGRSGTSVIALGPDASTGALLKVSDRPWGRRELEHQVSVLKALHTDSRLGAWSLLLPRVLAYGEVDGAFWVLETRLAGRDGRRHLNDPERRGRVVHGALAAIAELNLCTAAPVRVEEHQLERWIRQPAARVRAALPRRERHVLDDLEQTLVARLAGRRLAAGWTHGDYHPGNVLSSADGRPTGIVDWCSAEPDGLVLLDTVGCLLAVDASVRGKDLGAVVTRHVSAGTPPEVAGLVVPAPTAQIEGVGWSTLVLLAWLRHAAHYIATEPPGALNPVWVARNLRPVLRASGPWGRGDTPR